MPNRRIAVLFMALAFLGAAVAAEEGVVLERESSAPTMDRQRIARGLFRHSFENIRDPDTGVLLPESASLNPDGWPDFWEPVRAVGFPEYLIPAIRIVRDDSGMIPGAYRDEANHVLMMEFDGTRVGVRTRAPVPVDPSLAYQYSLMYRAAGLEGARIRAGVEWLRVDPAATALLRADEIPNLSTGQVDWPVKPPRMLVNDPPETANALRMFVILERDPARVGGAYHGSVWLDDITLTPLPKVVVDAPRDGPAGGGRIIPVRYFGLFDNIPDPDNPGFFKGKRYSRRVEITDIHNQPVAIGLPERSPVVAGETGTATEDIPFQQGRYGVYYLNIRLYDADDRLATDVIRSVAVMRPPRQAEGLTIRSGKPVYGVSSGVVPEGILAGAGTLRSLLARPGIRMTKVLPWPDDYAKPGGNQSYYGSLAGEVRNLRSGGIGATAVIAPPAAMFGQDSLAEAIANQGERLNEILVEAGRHLGLFVDGWQWGRDDDASLSGFTAGRSMETMFATLNEVAGGLPLVYNTRLGGGSPLPFPGPANVIGAFFPEKEQVDRMWPYAARVFPWLFEPFFRERGAIYPPHRLSALSPAPASDLLEAQARTGRQVRSWVTLEPPPAYPHEPNASAERTQLEQFLIRAVYATILSPDAVFLGDLFDPFRGMLRREVAAGGTLETAARPTYLAAATLVDQLEGSEYLGQMGLLPPFEAHVFRHPGTDQAVIALWHNDSADTHPLRRVEIASGPPLHLVDWAGNATPLAATFAVHRVPSFITGMSASLALTRMSVRIAPEPKVLAATRRQNQALELVNHMSRQAPVLFRIAYAARPDGTMENGWSVNPEEMRINLAPVTPTFDPGVLRYTVSPDPNSTVQTVQSGRADKSGSKISQVAMTVNTSPPADMLLYLPFRLRSELDVDIEVLPRVDDPHFATLQLKLRWFPENPARRRGEIKLFPYFVKKGRMPESLPFPITVKAMPVEERGKPEAMFESAELRIPLSPAAQTWVGLAEDGGSNFYLADVTALLQAQ